MPWRPVTSPRNLHSRPGSCSSPDDSAPRMALVAEQAQAIRTIATRYAIFISVSSILRRFAWVRYLKILFFEIRNGRQCYLSGAQQLFMPHSANQAGFLATEGKTEQRIGVTDAHTRKQTSITDQVLSFSDQNCAISLQRPNHTPR